jgi:hypothetical protein
MANFLSGMMMMGAWVISLFFFRFWKKTGDSFFRMFSISFGLMGIERWVLALGRSTAEDLPYVYCIRLLAFVTIIAAIVHKNRSEREVKQNGFRARSLEDATSS